MKYQRYIVKPKNLSGLKNNQTDKKWAIGITPRYEAKIRKKLRINFIELSTQMNFWT